MRKNLVMFIAMEIYKDIITQILQSDRATVKVLIPQLDKYVLDLSYRIKIKTILTDKTLSAEEKLLQIDKVM